MYRYALTIEYDGSPFHGWQVQSNVSTVQCVIFNAIKKLDANCENFIGAGRTDAGVHAIGQVAHVDLETNRDSETVKKAINYYLNKYPISVLAAKEVSADFHARFSAKKRHYTYKILSRTTDLTFERSQFWRVRQPLDTSKMKLAATYLIGKHDFTTFRSSICQASSPVKTIDTISIQSEKIRDGIIYEFNFSARSFLHNQVRSIVGCLEKVGCGKWDPQKTQEILLSKERSRCAALAPPGGLYLTKVEY